MCATLLVGNAPGVQRAQNAHSQAISRNGSASRGSLEFLVWDPALSAEPRSLCHWAVVPTSPGSSEKPDKRQKHSRDRHMPLWRWG